MSPNADADDTREDDDDGGGDADEEKFAEEADALCQPKFYNGKAKV